jgi:hypothetical protein
MLFVTKQDAGIRLILQNELATCGVWGQAVQLLATQAKRVLLLSEASAPVPFVHSRHAPTQLVPLLRPTRD